MNNFAYKHIITVESPSQSIRTVSIRAFEGS